MPKLLSKDTVFYSGSNLKKHFEDFLKKTKELKDKLPLLVDDKQNEDRNYLHNRITLLEAIQEKVLPRFDHVGHDCTKNKCPESGHLVNEFGVTDVSIAKDLAALYKSLFPEDARVTTPQFTSKETLMHLIDAAEFAAHLDNDLRQLEPVIQARIVPGTLKTAALKTAILWSSSDANKRAYDGPFEDYQAGNSPDAFRAIIERASGETLEALYSRHKLVSEDPSLPQSIRREIFNGQYEIISNNGRSINPINQHSTLRNYIELSDSERKSVSLRKKDSSSGQRVRRMYTDSAKHDSKESAVTTHRVVRRVQRKRGNTLSPTILENQITALKTRIESIGDELAIYEKALRTHGDKITAENNAITALNAEVAKKEAEFKHAFQGQGGLFYGKADEITTENKRTFLNDLILLLNRKENKKDRDANSRDDHREFLYKAGELSFKLSGEPYTTYGRKVELFFSYLMPAEQVQQWMKYAKDLPKQDLATRFTLIQASLYAQLAPISALEEIEKLKKNIQPHHDTMQAEESRKEQAFSSITRLQVERNEKERELAAKEAELEKLHPQEAENNTPVMAAAAVIAPSAVPSEPFDEILMPPHALAQDQEAHDPKTEPARTPTPDSPVVEQTTKSQPLPTAEQTKSLAQRIIEYRRDQSIPIARTHLPIEEAMPPANELSESLINEFLNLIAPRQNDAVITEDFADIDAQVYKGYVDKLIDFSEQNIIKILTESEHTRRYIRNAKNQHQDGDSDAQQQENNRNYGKFEYYFDKVYWSVLHTALKLPYIHKNNDSDPVLEIRAKWLYSDDQKQRELAIKISNLNRALTDLDSYKKDNHTKLRINSLVQELKIKLDIFILKLNAEPDQTQHPKIYQEFRNSFMDRLNQDREYLHKWTKKNIALLVSSVLLIGLVFGVARMAYTYASSGCKRADFWFKTNNGKQADEIQDKASEIANPKKP